MGGRENKGDQQRHLPASGCTYSSRGVKSKVSLACSIIQSRTAVSQQGLGGAFLCSDYEMHCFAGPIPYLSVFWSPSLWRVFGATAAVDHTNNSRSNCCCINSDLDLALYLWSLVHVLYDVVCVWARTLHVTTVLLVHIYSSWLYLFISKLNSDVLVVAAEQTHNIALYFLLRVRHYNVQ